MFLFAQMFPTIFTSSAHCNQGHFICPQHFKVTGKRSIKVGLCPLFLVQVCKYPLTLFYQNGAPTPSLDKPCPFLIAVISIPELSSTCPRVMCI